MKQRFSEALGRHEAILAAAICALVIGFAIAAPAFLGAGHLFSILRSMIVIGIMALGLLVVLIAGGVDVSVSATAVASMYVTVVTLTEIGYDGPVIVAFLISAVLGAALGLVNGALVSLFRLPTLIVTLGTLTLYRGALLAFVGTDRLMDLPAQMAELGRASVFVLQSSGGTRAPLHVGVVVLVTLAVALALALRYTGWGRAVYTLGGNEDAARRLGVPIVPVRLSVFAVSGGLAGIAGLMSASLIRAADPFTIVGSELTVLAAVILGGASIAGGRGTVLGTMFGVLLVTLVDSSLVLVGIPTEWKQVFVGVFLLLGVATPAIRRRRMARQRGVVAAA
ncbi:ABC transporter permease [Actinobacteria bacterium YIM 96077]|uniref:ABC transporter permease n=1 Tax=Phytoactinopolyspora halophila TaxID=1981511 RepID=A0A329QR21_9ACTN|nr:ABC transporter permease [Phytoactinopolyspora halophila]AYY12261.1 ABC transporter permease [Actinobacteria bacterium YIM 96077]RAW13822.1 ABC transporter permease [Phytoactinopolyspora halophila]